MNRDEQYKYLRDQYVQEKIRVFLRSKFMESDPFYDDDNTIDQFIEYLRKSSLKWKFLLWLLKITYQMMFPGEFNK